MSFSRRRVGALFRKELRDYRRNRFVILTMAFLPLLFVILPTVQLLTVSASASNAKLDAHIGLSLLYMLLIPAMVPSVLAAYSVVGEREQGTLEPVLITPVRREEFLVAKALGGARPHPRHRLCGLRHLPRRRGDLRPARRRLGRVRTLPPARPASLHPAARWLVDLGRHRHLHAVGRRASRPAARRARQPSPARHRRADVFQRDRADPRTGARARRRAADRRCPRMAGGSPDVRPGTARHRNAERNPSA